MEETKGCERAVQASAVDGGVRPSQAQHEVRLNDDRGLRSRQDEHEVGLMLELGELSTKSSQIARELQGQINRLRYVARRLDSLSVVLRLERAKRASTTQEYL